MVTKTEDKLPKNSMVSSVQHQHNIGTKNRTDTLMINWDSSVTQERKLQAWNLYRSVFGFLEVAFVSARQLLLVFFVPAVGAIGSKIPVPKIP